MMPTLSSGDVVFTQKISTYFDTYDRGDVVILDGKGMYGYDKEEYLQMRFNMTKDKYLWKAFKMLLEGAK